MRINLAVTVLEVIDVLRLPLLPQIQETRWPVSVIGHDEKVSHEGGASFNDSHLAVRFRDQAVSDQVVIARISGNELREMSKIFKVRISI